MVHVDRQVTDASNAPKHGAESSSSTAPFSVTATRDDYAYVLLGDPGLGKTTVFKQEAESTNADFFTARDFSVLPLDRESCANKTLFIDALDESRAGVQDGRSVLDQIRAKLIALGMPRFRLSCRAADWLGESDATALANLLNGERNLRVYRLQPLSDADITMLLTNAFAVADAPQFLQHARHNGIESLLANPQTLKMLAKAVGKQQQWPDSRASTYELACNTLATELNNEHQSAKRKSWPGMPKLLDAAGLISALFLCSDRSEIRIARSGANDAKALVLQEIVNTHALPMQDVVETNLFTTAGENAWIPAHRSVAEFLAARYVAGLVKDGLSPGRVASLILGADAGVVTSLRGFNAWLANCSPLARARLVEADPQGVLLYGDVKSFTRSNKAHLLDCLRQSLVENRSRISDDWNSPALGALVDRDMAEEFVAILRCSGRDRADQAMADLVVTALALGEKIEGVAPELLAVARDASRWSGMRRYALRTYLRLYAESDAPVLQLFKDVAAGRVVDDEDELLGTLLRHLYPEKLSIEAALEHLRAPKSSGYFGSFRAFWQSVFLQVTPSNRLTELLDLLAARPTLEDQRGNEYYWRFASHSLIRALEDIGDDIDDEKLYRWLGVTLGEYDHDHLEGELKTQLYTWFETRPQRLVALLRIAVKHLGVDGHLRQALDRLHNPAWPPQMGHALLALAESESRTALADELFWAAGQCLYDATKRFDLSIEQLESWVALRPRFAEAFTQLLFWEIPEWRIEQTIERANERREKQGRIEEYRKALSEKPATEFNVQALHYLALVHAGFLDEGRGDNPLARIQNFLGHDEVLVAKAFAAIEATCNRSDLPTADEMLQSYLKGKEWLIVRPLLTSLQLAMSSSPSEVFDLSEGTLSTALMAAYVAPMTSDASFRKLLAVEHPPMVADTFSRYATAALNAGKSMLNGAYEMTDDSAFAAAAKLALTPILTAFPRRASLEQLYDLARFIKSFASLCSERDVLEMVAKKLALKTLDVGQRTYWLAVGLMLAPKKYEKPLRNWVERNEIRIGHLGTFLDRRDQFVRVQKEMPASAIGLLIELLALQSRPDRAVGGVHQVTPDMHRGELVSRWTNELAAQSKEEARLELLRLSALPDLAPWLSGLHEASAAQAILQRDAHYRFPEPADVIETLAMGAPANVADLHAMLVDELNRLAADIASGDLDIYKQFWNTDSHNNVVSPKVEEAGRDALCALLRERLASRDVACEKEVQHADRKRSDITCSRNAFRVPIEIKTQMHKGVWRAVGEQLIDKYTTDPRTGGYGVYLVLWFGSEFKLESPSTGKKPNTAKAVQTFLESALSPAQRKLITICVIDVSSTRSRG